MEIEVKIEIPDDWVDELERKYGKNWLQRVLDIVESIAFNAIEEMVWEEVV